MRLYPEAFQSRRRGKPHAGTSIVPSSLLQRLLKGCNDFGLKKLLNLGVGLSSFRTTGLYKRLNDLHSNVSVVEEALAGWWFTGLTRNVLARDFARDFEQVIDSRGARWIASDACRAPETSNPLRSLIGDDKDLFVVMIIRRLWR